MENEPSEVVVMFSIQRKLSLTFSERYLNIMQNISRTTALSSFPVLRNAVVQTSRKSKINLPKIQISKRKQISRKSQQCQKKKCYSSATKKIPESTSSQAQSSTSPTAQFQSNTHATSSGQVKITSTITSSGLYHSAYYGTPHLRHRPPTGYTHLTPGSSSIITHTPFQPSLISPISSTSTSFEIPPIESSRYEPTSDKPLYQEQSGSRNKKTPNPLPRHKRESHINAEYRRRSKISNGFEALQNIVPSLRDNQPSAHQKESKSAMLNAAAEYIRELIISCDQNERTEQRLRQEIFELDSEIQCCQKGLPVGGVPTVDNPEVHLQTLFRDYLHDRINQNWKFWIFSFLVRPLFLSFTQMVTSSSFPAFLHSVKKWGDEKLPLNELRIKVIELLKYISTNTSVMSTPDRLPLDAITNFQKWQN